MFGLGVGELLLLVGVIAFLGGPKAVKTLARAFQTAHKAKNELTGQALIGKILDPDDEPPKKKKRRRKTRRKQPTD